MRTIEFPRGKDRDDPKAEVLRAEVGEMNGHRFPSFRIWFRSPSGEYLPTKRGVTVRLSELREVAAWLLEAADELDAPEPRQRRDGRTASTTGGGPELSAEEEARLF